MYNGGEAADQMVSYAFKGGEVVLRLSGAAAKNLAVYLTALLKQGGPSKGKTTLKRMIADGKELTVQRIDTDQIPYFNAMAKKYGVMFVAVRDRKNPDGNRSFFAFTTFMISQSCWVERDSLLTSVVMMVSPASAVSSSISRFCLTFASPCSRSSTIFSAPAAFNSRT